MKKFELSFYLNGMHMTEYWEAVSKMQAQAFCRQHHHGKIGNFESVVEIKGEVA